MKSTYAWEVSALQPWFRLGLRELFHYHDLVLSFVKRDLFAGYKQTLLGPLWIILQPLMTTLVYVVFFAYISKLSTGGIPAILFYLPGIIIWNYFTECLNGSMYTFIHYSHVFNKIYFPRLVVPISNVITNTFRLIIQFGVFLLIYIWYIFHGMPFHLNSALWLLPVLVILTAALSMGLGLLFSILTARYRDLENIVHFIIRLLMFASPVIYPSSIVPKQYKELYWANPLTAIIESFRIAVFYGPQHLWLRPLLVAAVFSISLLYISMAIFKHKESEIIDVI
jgi:lipopolysaccharide transport system permease protein